MRSLRQPFARVLSVLALVVGVASLGAWWAASLASGTRSNLSGIVDASIGSEVTRQLHSLQPLIVSDVDKAVTPTAVVRIESSPPAQRTKLLDALSQPAVAAAVAQIPGLRGEIDDVLGVPSTTKVTTARLPVDNVALAAKLTALERTLAPSLWGRSQVVTSGRADLTTVVRTLQLAATIGFSTSALLALVAIAIAVRRGRELRYVSVGVAAIAGTSLGLGWGLSFLVGRYTSGVPHRYATSILARDVPLRTPLLSALLGAMGVLIAIVVVARSRGTPTEPMAPVE